MQRLKELCAKTSSAETSINYNSQYATHDTKEDRSHDTREGSHDRKEGSHDTKEGSHDTKESSYDSKEGSHDTKEQESSHDTKESSHDIKEGSHDAKGGSHDTKESSHDSCGPTALVIADDTEAQSEDHKKENRTDNEEQNTANGDVLDGQETGKVENDGQDTSPSTPLPAVSNAIGSGLYIVGMHRKMVSS